MFFGAGNMIYSLWLGHIVDRHNYWPGVLGFVLSAVLFPLIGLIGIWSQRGCAFSFLAPVRSRPVKIAILLFILSVWGPFGAMPRAVLLTYASLQPFIPAIHPAMGHFLLVIIVGLLVTNPQKMVQIFGRWLMPGLLLASAGIFMVALTKPAGLSPSDVAPGDMALEGIHLGYQTMDGLAAIFFGKLLVEMFAQQKMPKRIYRKFFTITFISALSLLAIVYLMLIEAAARLTEEVQVTSPIMLMVEMSRHALGPQMGFIVALLMTGAALSTAIALALIMSDFIHTNVLKKMPRPLIIWSLMLITYMISLLGIEGIHAISGLPLQVLYPTILLLSIYLIAVHKPLGSLRDDAHLLDDEIKQ